MTPLKTTALIATLGLALPASAGAAYLSTNRAANAIRREAGPGTVLHVCTRESATSVTCTFATPATNFGGEEGWTWESYATAHLTRHGLVVHEP